MTDSLKDKRIAVFGSNSFAGSAFIARVLDSGANVIGFNRSPESSFIFQQYKRQQYEGKYKFVQADINHDLGLIVTSLHDFSPSVVVDFAGQGMVAESWVRPEQWFTTNVVSKVRLHEILRLMKGLEQYIRISTPEVYGNNVELQKESWHFNPSTPYAVTHAAIDMSLKAYYEHYGFPVIYSRFANFYGPGQQLYRIIPRTIIYALTHRKLQLHGGGRAVRAFIYGEDVANAIIRVMEKGISGEAYHFSPDDFYSIREVVSSIATYLNVDFDELVEISPDRPSKDQAYLMDSTKAKNELSWKPAVSLMTGIEKTTDWVSSNLDVINSLPLEYIHKA